MEQVGYDTYCNLLDEVIKEMQGIEIKQEQDIQIELPFFSSYIPEEYIENSSQKIEIYQDIALCKTEQDIQNITDEIIDRYGTMPTEVENLLEIARIKILAKSANVIKITQKRDGIVFIYDNNKFDMSLIETLVKKYNRRVRFSPGKDPYITFVLEKKGEREKLKEIQEFLRRKSEVGSRRSEVRSRKSEVGSRKSEVRGRKLEVGGRKLEVGGWKLEVGGWKLEVGGRKLEVGGWKLEVRS